MANVKITDLTELTTLSATDLVEVVDDPAGTPLSRKMTMLNLVKAAIGLTSSGTFEIRAVLHEETLGGSGSFDVTSISQDYTHLLVRLLLRGTVTATSDGTRIFFNNDTTDANYSNQYIQGAGTTADAARGDTAASVPVPAASSPADYFGFVEGFIPLYTGNKTKQITVTGAGREAATTQRIMVRNIHWENTAAINRITVITDNNPTDLFAAGSYMQVIGIKTSG